MAILGIDEVGRGPWAGPLVVGAVILPAEPPAWVSELRDSKKLSAKQRARLNAVILGEAAATGLGWVWQYEIDEVGLAAALRLAARRALHTMKKQSPAVQFTEILIDGTQNLLSDTPLAQRVTTLVKGDDLIKEISAASIIAKVARDRYMIELAAKYPAYGFEKHKGYGTAQHRAALLEYGVTPEHRLSLKPIRKMLGLPLASDTAAAPPTTTTSLGHQAETVVVQFLTDQGHEIIARNYKNQFCEIDLVSRQGENLYFTEVKYRQNAVHGSGFEAITPVKRRQMAFATQIFLANHPSYRSLQPYLAAASVTGADFHLEDYLVLDE